MRIIHVAIAAAAATFLPASVSAAGQSSVQVHASKYGRILFDGRGFVLYAFTHDPPGRSACGGECAKKWPPYIVSGRLAAGPGAKGALLGTTRRDDGNLQATYAGRPLYYFVGDKKPGQILCQGVSAFGGVWLVERPDGRLVR